MAIVVSAKELHRVVSTAIIYKNGQYLLLKRSPKEKAFPEKWTVPGGGLYPDDYTKTRPNTKGGHWYFAIEKSLRREIKEETGLEVGELQYLLDLTFVRPDGVPVVVLSYFAPYKSGKVKLNDEMLVDFAWVPLRKLKKYDLIDGIFEEIQMVDKILNGASLKRVGKEKLFHRLFKKSI